MEQSEYRYWLANLPNIGVRRIERLLDIYGNAENIFRVTREELYALKKDGAFGELMSDNDIETITQKRDCDVIHRNYTKLYENGIYFVSREEDNYPDKLRNIFGAPYALYVKGRLPSHQDKLLAVVGARECSPYGKEMAKYLAGAIAKRGITIISGLARGIDSYAHQGALSAGGGTYGIMGCGIDICYPRENINLYMDMQREGGILSEYAPGIQPIAGNFPMRNRIISGLSDGILIIEAKEKSGSLITVDYGLEQGKEIYALPGRATDRLSEGCNNLIKMGAKMVTSPKDILEDMLFRYDENKDQAVQGSIMLNAQQYQVFSCLNTDPKHLEEISILTMLPMEELMEHLLELELRGMIRQTLKNFYCK